MSEPLFAVGSSMKLQVTGADGLPQAGVRGWKAVMNLTVPET